MAKTKSNRKRGGSKQRGNWSSADHEHRTNTRIASLNKKHRRQQEQEGGEEGEPPASNKHPKTTNDDPHHERPLHQIRRTKKAHRNNHNRLASQVPEDAYKRSHLAHDNFDQIDSSKLRLATAQIQRKVTALKERLESWDPIDEAKLAKQQQQEYEDKSSIDYKMKIDAANRALDRESRQTAQAEYNILYAKHGVNSSTNRRKANLMKKPRKGPESWKLRGAARPAWEVYDFDVRYVDVHLKARDDANEKARRSKNVIHLCRGRFAMDGDANDDVIDDDEQEMNGDNENEAATTTTNNDSSKKQNQQPQSQQSFPPPQPHCRQYLSLLTQLGSLHLHRKNYSSARKSFLEAIDLEGTHHTHSITNARYQLMNMYLSTNRPTSARKLWNTLQPDNSAWIKYSAALIEYVSWNLLQEAGSTSTSAERYLCEAIRGNVYVAYFLAWPQTLERAMEYTDEVVERGLGCSKSGSMLEAIEYGCCHYLAAGEGGGNGGDGGEKGEEEEDAMDRGMGMWLQTEGSLDWVRSVLLKVMNNGSEIVNNNNNTVVSNNNNDDDEGGEQLVLTKPDLLSWDSKLNKEEEEYERERGEKEKEKQQQWENQQRWSQQQESDEGVLDNDATSEDDDDEDEPDVVMYAGMFRTAMDWLQDGGEFLKEPSFDYIMEAQEEETEATGEGVTDVTDADVVLEGDNENKRDDSSEDDTSKDGDDDNEEEEKSASDHSDSDDE